MSEAATDRQDGRNDLPLGDTFTNSYRHRTTRYSEPSAADMTYSADLAADAVKSDDMSDTAPFLPAGDYAIVECLGHRTMIGRYSEVERFGSKMMALEPIFAGELLAPILVAGASLYAVTPCSAEVALSRAPKSVWEVPTSLRAVLPVAALPAPDDEDEPEFAPAFLDADD